ncbi:MAG: hypothetical protein WBM44_10565 [Waterburya sp.]
MVLYFLEITLQGGSVDSSVKTLDRQQAVQTITAPRRRIVGVGNVGREPGKAIYTLYSPYSDRLEFKTINYFALPRSESTFRAIFR